MFSRLLSDYPGSRCCREQEGHQEHVTCGIVRSSLPSLLLIHACMSHISIRLMEESNAYDPYIHWISIERSRCDIKRAFSATLGSRGAGPSPATSLLLCFRERRLIGCWRAAKKRVDELLVSWDEVHAIQERAVKRGLERRKARARKQNGRVNRAWSAA